MGYTRKGGTIEVAPYALNLMSYEEAVLYCQFCNHNGHNDWRMPTYQESVDYNFMGWGWYIEYNNYPDYNISRYTIPVRDI
jgi:hypothetical protein